MRLRKTLIALGLAGVVAALAVGGVALAQTPTPTPNQAKTNYQNVFLDKLAAAVGKTRDELNAAITSARNDTVDQEVADGKLTQQQADKIKSGPANGLFGFGFGFRGGEHERRGGAGFMMGGANVRDAIAQALGMTTQDLTTQLRSGKTLAQLAQDKGKDAQAIKDAIKNAVTPQLDQAVANGKMTKDQETQILDNIQNSDLNSFGGYPMMGRGWHWRGNGQQKPAPTQQPSSGPASFQGSAL